MSYELKAGVAGAGVFGAYHADKYADLDDVQLTAVYDVDYERAHALAARHSAIPFTDYQSFLAAVDIVTIASPATTHYQLAQKALAAGKHSLVEKPLALELPEADRLVDMASDNGIVLQVGHQERFVFEAFGVMTRRRKPLSIHCTRRNPATGRGEDVSVVIDLMIHDLDLLRRLGLGSVESSTAQGCPDAVQAVMHFTSGCEATLAASRRAEARERVMKLVYDDGVIEIDFVNRQIENSTTAPLAATFEDERPDRRMGDPLGFGVACFVEAVQGKRPTAITGVEGREALEWARMIESSLLGDQFAHKSRVSA